MGKTAIRIGVDLGGTKIEALALDAEGKELLRKRVSTPQGDYKGIVSAIAGLVHGFESKLDAVATVGVGIPGCIPKDTGVVKNANTLCLNGNPLDKDLSAALSREVRVANDANCLAVSESTDGAAAGYRVVFAVIIGTGCGGGVAIDSHVHDGPNGAAGEWGHNPLPWQTTEEYPGPPCYCGQKGCNEVWISGTGFSNDYNRITGRNLTGPEIVAAAEKGEAEALAAFARYEDRLARSLGGLVNLLDPDCIVLGGGMSKNARLYVEVPKLLPKYVFGNSCNTPILPAKHGDSSGVRGAAWLWSLK
jgi:fructokinase